MNDDACNGATKRLVSLNNKATLGGAVFAGAVPAPNDAAASVSGAGAASGGGGGVFIAIGRRR